MVASMIEQTKRGIIEKLFRLGNNAILVMKHNYEQNFLKFQENQQREDRKNNG